MFVIYIGTNSVFTNNDIHVTFNKFKSIANKKFKTLSSSIINHCDSSCLFNIYSTIELNTHIIHYDQSFNILQKFIYDIHTNNIICLSNNQSNDLSNNQSNDQYNDQSNDLSNDQSDESSDDLSDNINRIIKIITKSDNNDDSDSNNNNDDNDNNDNNSIIDHDELDKLLDEKKRHIEELLGNIDITSDNDNNYVSDSDSDDDSDDNSDDDSVLTMEAEKILKNKEEGKYIDKVYEKLSDKLYEARNEELELRNEIKRVEQAMNIFNSNKNIYTRIKNKINEKNISGTDNEYNIVPLYFRDKYFVIKYMDDNEYINLNNNDNNDDEYIIFDILYKVLISIDMDKYKDYDNYIDPLKNIDDDKIDYISNFMDYIDNCDIIPELESRIQKDQNKKMITDSDKSMFFKNDTINY